MELQLWKNEMDVAALKEQEVIFNESIFRWKEIVQKRTPDKAKLKELEEIVKIFQKEWVKANKAVSKVEKKVQALNKKVMDIGGTKTKGQQKQLKEKEQVLKKSANEYAAVEAKEQALREKEVDIKHEVEKFDGILKENHHKVKHWKNEKEDDPDYLEVVPNSEFVISRKAYKDDSSDYYINNCKRPFKEVAALLRSSGIDMYHNRFLIFQGELDQIAMMKPKAVSEHEDGMLEYLEDIIGSNKYKEPIEELAKEEEALSEVFAELSNRVKTLEKEMNDLQGYKDEAIAYINMENMISKKKNVLYQKYAEECLKNEGTAAEKINELKAAFEAICKEMNEITS
ncbi:Structural maintenance of chromosomes protein 4 [Exaiptasia diaphana]|nr:Structural maintenance of chromosomes protein 4 [Exaiptasia diaphana]